MRFHRIELRDYKAIRKLKVEPLANGITILQGDNEVGKSSIAEALWFVFEQHDDSTSQAVKAVRPAGRDAATEIEVEVSSGPYRFTYFKRFHRQPRTELRILEPRREAFVGREAHQRALAILDETIDRGLWQALRVQQGANLEPLIAGEHQSLLSALDQVAGQSLGAERDQTLFERITAEYERYHTATGRERTIKDAPDAAKLRRQRDAAEDACRQVETRIVLMEERALRASALDQELAGIAARVDAASADQARLAASEAARREHFTVVEKLEGDLRLKESVLRELRGANESLEQAESAVREREEELQALRAGLAALLAPIADARSAVEASTEALRAADDALALCERSRSEAEEALHIASAEFTAQTMAERLERLERNAPERETVAAWLKACRVDGRAVAAIEQAEDRLTKLQARRDAEGATIEIATLEGLDFEVNGKPVRIEPGRARRGPVIGEFVATLPGGVTITVRAGSAARELDAQILRGQEALDRLLSAASVESAEAAQALLLERTGYEERLRGLTDQISADARDLSLPELRDKLARERARLDELLGGRPRVSIDQAKALREAATTAHATAQEAARGARLQAEVAASTAAALERERDQHEHRASALEDELARLGDALALARQRAGDDDRVAGLREAEAARAFAAEQHERAATALAAMSDESIALAAVEASLAEMDALARRLSHERAGIQGVLEEAGAEGLQQRLVEAGQELTAAEEELESFLRRANAARTLFAAMRARRDEARGNYAGPLRERLEALGRLVFGPSFAIELTDDLRIARRTLSGTTLELGQLSVGVREQLAVLTRLACASLVSTTGAPLVLDDVFGWADPVRLRKLGPILAEAASEAQVLLFTCVPGRFEAVAPARVISLPSGQVEDRRATGDSPRAEPVASPRSVPPFAPPPPQPQAAFDLFVENESAPASARR